MNKNTRFGKINLVHQCMWDQRRLYEILLELVVEARYCVSLSAKARTADFPA